MCSGPLRPAFALVGFFDPDDLAQAKYEMARRATAAGPRRCRLRTVPPVLLHGHAGARRRRAGLLPSTPGPKGGTSAPAKSSAISRACCALTRAGHRRSWPPRPRRGSGCGCISGRCAAPCAAGQPRTETRPKAIACPGRFTARRERGRLARRDRAGAVGSGGRTACPRRYSDSTHPGQVAVGELARLPHPGPRSGPQARHGVRRGTGELSAVRPERDVGDLVGVAAERLGVSPVTEGGPAGAWWRRCG
jgi:hypothetical protein